MLVIGESIHVISDKVKKAIAERDKKAMQALALEQVEKGADVLDLNIGPQRKTGPEVMSWMVETVQEVVAVPLSLDSTNVAAIEAGLKLCKQKPIINSTDATPERMSAYLPLAAKYGASIIALSLAKTGLPTSADARLELVVGTLLPALSEYEIPMTNVYFDPLVLTINGNQDQVLQTIEAVRFFKQVSDPPPKTTCGLSNVSNSVPDELRPLLNRVFMVMMMGAGLDSAIMDPLDKELMRTLRILRSRDASTPEGKFFLALHDAYAQGVPFDLSGFDATNPRVRDLIKTVEVMENKWTYAHGYLKL